MNIDILYEDKHIVAINKPAGLVVHADGRTTEKTVVDWVLEHYPEVKDVGEPIELTKGGTIIRPGIVHRIDRDTSGVLLIAKTEDGFVFLKSQFQRRQVKKTYHAFVYGVMKEKEGEINRPIARSRKDFRLWSAQRGGRGEARDAVTTYKALKYGDDVTFIEAHPLTGRTHQIRVHFKAINHPVVADPLYAPKREAILGFKRLALHAREVIFETIEGKEVKVEAPYPADFEVALSMLV